MIRQSVGDAAADEGHADLGLQNQRCDLGVGYSAACADGPR